ERARARRLRSNGERTDPPGTPSWLPWCGPRTGLPTLLVRGLPAAARAEAARASVRAGQGLGPHEARARDLLDDELGDAVAATDLEGLPRVGVEQGHGDLSAVARVDRA